jgi:hypothetical protein
LDDLEVEDEVAEMDQANFDDIEFMFLGLMTGEEW